MSERRTDGQTDISVLLDNCRTPTFVSFLSTVLILSYFCPVSVSILSYFCPLSYFCLVFVFQISVSSCSRLVFVILHLNIVPLLSPFGPLGPWQMVRTNTGQKLDRVIFPFSTWSPCSWTKSGQNWDTRMSQVCPLFVQAPYSI